MRVLPSALVSIVLLAGCAVPGLVADLDDFEPVADAGWLPGFHFAYVSSGNVDVTGHASEPGEGTETIDEHEAIPAEPAYEYTVLNTEFQQDNVGYYLVDLVDGGLLAIRARDLQPLPTTLSASGDSATVRVNALPVDYSLLRFPLHKRDSWSGTFPFTELGAPDSGEFGGAALRIDSLVRGMHRIDTALGPQDAIRIEHLLTVPGIEQMVDAARAAAAAQGVNVERFDMSMDVRIIVDYVPALHNVAHQEVAVKQSMDVAASKGDEHFEAVINAEAHMALDLSAADFTAGAQIPISELGKVTGVHGTATTYGIPDSGSPMGGSASSSVSLFIENTQLVLPDASTIMRVTSAGSGSGQRVDITNADARYDQSAPRMGDADTFSFEPTAPGLYTAQAVSPNGASPPQDIQVDLDDSVDGACTLGLPGAGACDAVAVDLAGGVAEARFSLSQPILNLGTLVFTDGLGQEFRQEIGPTARELVVPDPVAGPGALHFEPTLGLPTTVTYHIQATADEPQFNANRVLLPIFQALL